LSVRGQDLVRPSASADLSELREGLPQRREELHRGERVYRPRHRGVQLSEMRGETRSRATVDDVDQLVFQLEDMQRTQSKQFGALESPVTLVG